MKKLFLLLLISAACKLTAEAQYSKYVIELKDKNNSPYSLSNPSAFLSAKAIDRRQRQQIPLDSTDLPINPAYLQAIASVPGVTLLNRSKWLNQVLIYCPDSTALSTVKVLPFVKNAEPVAQPAFFQPPFPLFRKFEEPVQNLPDKSLRFGANGRQGTQGTTVLDYGNTYNQIHIHEGEYLHNLGFTGAGMTIAILDAGFYGYNTNPAMDSTRLQGRILGTWDYVMNDTSVSEDHPHGLYCFSILAANKPGSLVGSAPHASYWLLRTEDAATEYPVEEQNWLAAAEFADSAGADMISSSLGYSDFTDPVFNHSYAQRDGHTTLITRAANLAISKGMIVTNSAGNSGDLATEGKYVICPADGDSVLAIGATDFSGNIASFSSWGPNGAGRLKPDIVSVGVNTVLANTAGNAASGSGTSFSNPNVCGLIACLWEAFPEFSNREIVAAVIQSSSKYLNPDNRYGYGLPDFRIAYGLLAKERDYRRINQILGNSWIKAYPVPFRGDGLTLALRAPESGSASLQLIDASGRILETQSLSLQQDQQYLIRMANSVRLPAGVYFIRFQSRGHKTSLPVMKQ